MFARTAVLVACTTIFAFGQNWPQFRGPAGKGLAVGKPPVNFAPDEKTQVWKTSVPFGQSSPSVWGDRIFLTSGDREGKELTVAAYNRFTGKIAWQKSIAVEKVEQTHPRASPATATVLQTRNGSTRISGHGDCSPAITKVKSFGLSGCQCRKR